MSLINQLHVSYYNLNPVFDDIKQKSSITSGMVTDMLCYLVIISNLFILINAKWLYMAVKLTICLFY